MTPDEESRRAAEATALLANPLLVEAFAMLNQRLASERRKFETTPERAERLRMLEIAFDKFHGYLTQLVYTGRMNDFEEQRKRSLKDLIPWAQ